MLFNELNIDPRCLEVLNRQGIKTPTPVQEQAIPLALECKDIVAIAQTGTGKTLGFSLPSLTHLGECEPMNNSMLVLTPTRELAIQVNSVLEPLATAMKLRTACIYGGVGMEPQTKALRRGVSIIVATPGRLLDHMQRGHIKFHHLSILVLDEADRMLDMGFLPDIKRIVGKLPKDRQTLMFSATFPKEVERMAAEMQHEPVRVEVGVIATPVDSVRQELYTVDHGRKMELLSQLLQEPNVESALVFIGTKYRTDRIAKALHRDGYKVQAIHGDRTQSQRQQALTGFRQGRYNILVATDIAARGLDIQGISHVINYDIPKNSDDYIHRIGRTARANTKGNAITFVSPDEIMLLRNIEKALGSNIPREQWEGSVPVASIFRPNKPEAAKDKRGGGFQRKRSMFRQRASR